RKLFGSLFDLLGPESLERVEFLSVDEYLDFGGQRIGFDRRHGPPILTRITHDRLRPPLRSFPPMHRQRSSPMRCGIAVVALPPLDEKSLSRASEFFPFGRLFRKQAGLTQ